jgi:aryl-alcohol dehydrogenase-like predicted oxidoreductase
MLAYSPLAQGLLTGTFARPEDVDDERARLRFYTKNRPGTVHDEDGYEREVFEAVGRIRAICDEIGKPMADVALAWVLHQPGIAAVLAGARKPEQIIENVQAADLELSPPVLERLNGVTEEFKTTMGPNADPWRTKSRIR